jgi:hypothetical protein
LATKNGLLTVRKTGELAPNRERADLETKLRALGLVPPWI